MKAARHDYLARVRVKLGTVERLYLDELVKTRDALEGLQACMATATIDAFEQARRNRKRVEMLFAHLKRILRLGRLRLQGPCGAQDEFTLAAIAQNLRRLAKLLARPRPASHQMCCVKWWGVGDKCVAALS